MHHGRTINVTNHAPVQYTCPNGSNAKIQTRLNITTQHRRVILTTLITIIVNAKCNTFSKNMQPSF